MRADLLLAIDAGTGSARAALFDTAGAEVASAAREWSHAGLDGAPGSQVFDTAHNWRLICECVREALAVANATGDQVAAVSAASMREGMVLYDESGAELWACPNVDSRAGEQAAQLIAEGAAAEIYERGGDWVAITAPARLRWIAEREPDLFARTARMGMLADWILTRLGGIWSTDPSLGSSSGMFDLARRAWSPRILDICGLDSRVVPTVADAGTKIGEVTDEAAAQTGLRAGVPVVAGGADTQLALTGIGLASAGACAVVGGSFWQLTALVAAPTIDPQGRLRTLCHAAPGLWMIEGIGFWSGLAMRWYRDAFCELEVAAESGRDPYELIEAMATPVPPGANGIVAVLSNVMNACNWVHAAAGFLGFEITRPDRSGRGACARAIEEAAAYVARAHLEIVREVAGVAGDELTMAGGAARGALWPQIVADVTGVPVSIPIVKEATCLGAALMAGVGAGVFANAAQAAATVSRTERVVTPDPAAAGEYERLYHEWRDLYPRALDLSPDRVPRPLWRAAGT